MARATLLRNVAFVVAFFCVGLASLVLTPPFQFPDGGAHYFRAFGIFESHFVGQKQGLRSGAVIPDACGEDFVQFADLIGQGEHKLTLCEWNKRMAASPELNDWEMRRASFAEFSNTAMYSPATYLPQALAIALVKRLRGRDLVAYYTAALFSLLACTLILALSLRLLDFSWSARNLCFLAAGIPMGLFLMGTPSSDGLTLMLGVLVAALALRLGHEPGNRVLFPAYLVVSGLLGLCKGLYFMVPIASLPLALPGFPLRLREHWRRALLVIAASVVPFLVWTAVALRGYGAASHNPDVNPAGQLSYILHHIPGTFSVLVMSFRDQAPGLRYWYIGVLGWLETLLPVQVINGYWLALLVIPLFGARVNDERGAIDWPARVWIAGSFLTFLVLVYLALYTTWTAVGASRVEGMQGRYFLPFTALLLCLTPPLIKLGPRLRVGFSSVLLAWWCFDSHEFLAALAVRYWSSLC